MKDITEINQLIELIELANRLHTKIRAQRRTTLESYSEILLDELERQLMEANA